MAYCSDRPSLGGVLGPLAEAALPQVVLLVQQQLIQAGSGDVYQPQFGLAGGR